jgi:ABC-2 type transport system permease protein
VRKVLVVAARDYQAAVRTKSFLVGLLIMPVMMGGSIVVSVLLKDVKDVRAKRFAVVDRTPGQKLFAALDEGARERNEKETRDPETGKVVHPPFVLEAVPPAGDDPESVDRQRFELSERVRSEDLFGFLEIGPDVFRPPTGVGPPGAAVRYQSNSPTYEEFPRWAEKVINQAVQKDRFTEARLPEEQVRVLLTPVPLQSKGLSKRNPETGAIEDAPDENRLALFLVPTGLMMLMFMMTLLGSSPLLQGIVEEKMQRIAEVLLGSLNPFQLMLGKLLGSLGVSLTLTGVYLAGAYWSAHRYGFAALIPVEVLAWFVVFLALAVTMYGSLFIAVGAACTDLRETQNLLWPVMLLATFPMFFLGHILNEPNSSLSVGLSFFPPATPALMAARMAIPPGVPSWQPALGVVLVLLTTLLFVWAAGRIFRVGILLHGKGAKVGDLVKWVFRG